MNTKRKLTVLLTGFVFLFLTVAPSLTGGTVSAHKVNSSRSSHTHDGDTISSDKVTITSEDGTETESEEEMGSTTTKQSGKDRKSGNGTKLEEAKLKVCKKREKTVNNIMSRVADRGQKHLDLFTSIADKTKVFYEEKGRTLSNYDELVADVEDKRVAAQAEVDALSETRTTFSCDGTDPKGAAAAFKEEAAEVKSALKAYKTSVKNLIVGVKSAQSTGVTNEETNEGDQ